MAGFETGKELMIYCIYKVRVQFPWAQGDEWKRGKIDATAIMKLSTDQKTSIQVVERYKTVHFQFMISNWYGMVYVNKFASNVLKPYTLHFTNALHVLYISHVP